MNQPCVVWKASETAPRGSVYERFSQTGRATSHTSPGYNIQAKSQAPPRPYSRRGSPFYTRRRGKQGGCMHGGNVRTDSPQQRGAGRRVDSSLAVPAYHHCASPRSPRRLGLGCGVVGGGEGGCQTDASAVVGWLGDRWRSASYHHGERSGSAALLVLATCVLNGSIGAFTTNLPVVEDVQQRARRAAGEWWRGRKGLTKPGPARFVVDLRCSRSDCRAKLAFSKR